MRQASLLLAGLAFGEKAHLDLWSTLKPDSSVEEVVRSFFVRQPLWVVPALAAPADVPEARPGRRPRP